MLAVSLYRVVPILTKKIYILNTSIMNLYIVRLEYWMFPDPIFKSSRLVFEEPFHIYFLVLYVSPLLLSPTPHT